MRATIIGSIRKIDRFSYGENKTGANFFVSEVLPTRDQEKGVYKTQLINCTVYGRYAEMLLSTLKMGSPICFFVDVQKQTVGEGEQAKTYYNFIVREHNFIPRSYESDYNEDGSRKAKPLQAKNFSPPTNSMPVYEQVKSDKPFSGQPGGNGFSDDNPF